jgi:hypothetical protein
VEQDRGDAAQQLPLPHPGQVVEQLLLCDPERGGRRRVRLRHDRHVALELADHGDVEVVVRLRLGLGRRRGLDRRGQVLGAARHLEVHADLEQRERRKLADRLRAGLLGQDLERAVEPQLRVRLGRDREPEVEVVVAQVVVRHAGVGVHDLGGAVRVLRVDLRGDEHRLVAQRARVEDRRDLPDDPLVEQAPGARHDLVLGDPGQLPDAQERARLQREAALEQVEQLAVEVVERDRGAVAARADLGGRGGCAGRRHASHPATSLAW